MAFNLYFIFIGLLTVITLSESHVFEGHRGKRSPSEPLEDSPLYKAAMEGKVFSENVKRFRLCRGKPHHITEPMLKAAVACKAEETLECFITCGWDQTGVTKSQKLNTEGLHGHVDRFFGSHPETVRNTYKAAFNLCFNKGEHVLQTGKKCVENKVITECIIQWFNKICIDGVDHI